MTTVSRSRLGLGLLLAWFTLGGTALADDAADARLVTNLRNGGYVLAMRHAHAPRQVPAATAENPAPERQLDDAGRTSAAAMGEALRALGVPIGATLTSPTLRARETAVQLGFAAEAIDELGDGGRDMLPDAEGRRSARLRELASTPPAPHTNALLITHAPNLTGAFGDAAAGMADGEALVLEPRGGEPPAVVARVTIEQWPVIARRLAAE